jgi:hypothetical protein
MRSHISHDVAAVTISLLRAVRIVVRADSDPARQVLFASLMDARWPVRFAHDLHGIVAGTWISTLLVGCYGLAALLSIAPARNHRARVLAVARHANARRQVARVTSWIGEDECGTVRTGFKTLVRLAGVGGLTLLFAPRELRRALRLVRAYDRRHGFLESCRAVEAVAWYARSLMMLAERRPGAVLVSGDSNPEEVGFIAAARALDIPQVFVAHAYPTPFSPPLNFTLSILEGEQAVDARRAKGPITGDILLAGLEGESALLDPRRIERANPVIGIFPPKAFSWKTLAAIVDDCRMHYHARQIVIRWHPSMLESPHLANRLADRSDIVEYPGSAPFHEVARQCDWVIAADNSNVHLPLLKLGIPSVAVSGLGLYPRSRSDLYGFIEHGIVFPPVESIRALRADEFATFFSDCWVTRFKRYDASYLLPPGAIENEVRRAIRRLIDAPAAHTAAHA